ncbi:MAG: M3 family metallopeptidase [Candidatus Zixiibacteriota bacterium]
MFFKLAIVLSLLMLVGFTLSCREESMPVERLQSVLDSLELKLDWLDYRLAGERWAFNTTGKADSLEFYENLYNYVFADLETYNLLNRHKNLVKEEEDIKRFELLNARFLSSIIEAKNPVKSLGDTLMGLHQNYQPEYMSEFKTLPEISDVIANDKNRTQREMAFRTYYQLGQNMESGMERLFRIRNQQARKTGYNNYMALLANRDEIKPDQCEKLIKQIDSLTTGAYMGLIEKIRGTLSFSEVELWDIPYYFSGVNNEINAFFPIDSQLDDTRASLSGLGFQLDKLPIYLTLEESPERPGDTKTFIIKTPYDQRLQGNIGSGFAEIRRLHEQFGYLLYSSFIAQDKHLYNQPLYGPFADGMLNVFGSITESKEWLGQYTDAPQSLIDRFVTASREKHLIDLRLLLVRMEFEFEAYTNPTRDLNKLYWDIFERYMSLPRHDDIKIWALDRCYINRPLTYKNDLLAVLIAAQTLTYLEKNNDSIVGNPETRAFLVQNYFRFGSRYGWQDLLQRGTGEDLNISYYLDWLDI